MFRSKNFFLSRYLQTRYHTYMRVFIPSRFVITVAVVLLWLGSQSADAATAKSFTVTAPTFTVAFEKDTYLFVDPFHRELSMWGTVKNTGPVADTISFSMVGADGRESPAGFVYLASGESSAHEFGKITREMSNQETEKVFRFRMASREHASSRAETSVTVFFSSISFDEASGSTIAVNVYDKNTRQLVDDVQARYYLGSESRTEPLRLARNGRYEAIVPDSSALDRVAKENGITWDGYTVEVSKSGYKTQVVEGLRPESSRPVEKEIFLEPLAETLSYEAQWLEKLEYPGVWRISPSKDWKFIAVAMGKHPDPWDPKQPAPTNVYLFTSAGDLVWKYPVDDTVWGLDISPDGSLVAAGTQSGSLHVIRHDGTTAWKKKAPPPTNLRELRFSNTGKYLAGETSIKTIEIYDSHTGEIIYEYDPGVEVFWRGVAFSNDDRYAVFAGDSSLVLIDVEARKPLWRKYIAGVPYDVRIAKDHSAIAVADKGDVLWYYGFDGTLLWHVKDITVQTDMDMTSDGSSIVTLSHDGTVRKFDARGNLIWRRALGFGGHNGLDMTADGTYIAVGSGGKEFPYSLFILDGDGNVIWKHSQEGPVPEPYHPYMMSAMTVAIRDDASALAAGYGTGFPGIQFFQGATIVQEEGEEKGMKEEVETVDWFQKNDGILVAIGSLVGLILAVMVARRSSTQRR